MKKLAYIIQSIDNSGGMERVLSTKANWLANREDWQVYIITKYSSNEKPFFDFDNKIIIKTLNIKKPTSKWSDKISSKDLKKFKLLLENELMEIKPNYTISLFGAEYKFLNKINDGSKKIIEFHYSRNYLSHLMISIPDLSFRKLRQWRARYLEYLEQKAAKQYDTLVLLSKKDQELWGNPANSKVIPNPISFRSDKKSSLQNKKIIAAGRLIAQKGFDLLIQAFNQIHNDIKDWDLVIYGEGQDKQFLQDMILSYNLRDRIKIKPPIKNLEQELLSSSIFAFPSRYEGFGLVLTEAMECGLPCVAFDCECGPSEIIDHEKDGYLIETGNINAFAEKLKLLALDDALRRDMGDLAKTNVSRFYEDQVMKSWVKLFQSL